MNLKGENLVLYSVSDGARRPLLSIAPGDQFGAAKVNAAASEEITRCLKSGQPHPMLKLVHEVRTANEAGVQNSATFTECDPLTCLPRVEGDKGVANLDSLFTKKEGA